MEQHSAFDLSSIPKPIARASGIGVTTSSVEADAMTISDALHVETRQSHGEIVVGLRGEADMATAPLLASTLSDCRNDGIGRVVVDCCELEFMDGGSLGMLIATRSQLRRDGGDLVVRAAPPMLLRILEILDWGDKVESA